MQYSVTTLSTILVLLILFSAFFSAAEISTMSLNRYRLRHLVRKKDRKALRINQLLERPERLLGVVLIGNTFANIFASTIATLIGQRTAGTLGVAIATPILTLLILIFAEMAPKTLAALYPQTIAFRMSLLLTWLLRFFSPLVWLINFFSKLLLRCFGVNITRKAKESLSSDELRSIVYETGGLISSPHKKMLISILDLEKVTVEDIMVPRHEIVGIDVTQPWDDILEQLETSQHTRLPVYTGSIARVKGIIHLRDILNLLVEERFDKTRFLQLAEPCYFIPEGVPLHTQLLNFLQEQERTALVVNEYGDIQGLVTLEDILEEIVGEFTTDLAATAKTIHPQKDGSYLLDGSASIRELNRTMNWHFPQIGPKTLSGLITEYLGFIPPAHTCLKLAGYRLEILQVKDTLIKTVRMLPP